MKVMMKVMKADISIHTSTVLALLESRQHTDSKQTFEKILTWYAQNMVNEL